MVTKHDIKKGEVKQRPSTEKVRDLSPSKGAVHKQRPVERQSTALTKTDASEDRSYGKGGREKARPTHTRPTRVRSAPRQRPKATFTKQPQIRTVQVPMRWLARSPAGIALAAYFYANPGNGELDPAIAAQLQLEADKWRFMNTQNFPTGDFGVLSYDLKTNGSAFEVEFDPWYVEPLPYVAVPVGPWIPALYPDPVEPLDPIIPTRPFEKPVVEPAPVPQEFPFSNPQQKPNAPRARPQRKAREERELRVVVRPGSVAVRIVARSAKARMSRPTRDRKLKNLYVAALFLVNRTYGAFAELLDTVDAVLGAAEDKYGRPAMMLERGNRFAVTVGIFEGTYEVDLAKAAVALAFEKFQDIAYGQMGKATANAVDAGYWNSPVGMGAGPRL